MLDLHTTPNNESNSFIGYTRRREFGKATLCDHQKIVDNLTAKRTFKPLVADTPINCRSTYLLRLNCTGKIAAAAHGDHSVGIYCSSSGRLLSKCVGHGRSPWTLTFHPSQPYLLASGCLGGTIRLWNLECLSQWAVDKNHSALELSCMHIWKHTGAIASLSFHSVHPILVAAWTQEVVFYDWVSGRMLSVWRFVSNQSRVRWVKFAPSGTLLYTATANPSTFDEPGSHHSKQFTHVVTKASPHEVEMKSSNSDSPKLHGRRIPRHLLLEFLIRRSDSWYQNLGICAVCSVRLCRWAGTLGPEFPTTGTDLHFGMHMARKAAHAAVPGASITDLTLSHVIREVLATESTGQFSQVHERLRCDANPASVAIIEDIPVHEFLLSRGNYCQTSKATVFADGFCCGGHARDLVIAHRELMRHSLCRLCLSEFWSWSNKHVCWWDWSPSYNDPDFTTETNSTSNVVATHSSADKIKKTEDHAEMLTSGISDSSVGICIQCRAKMFLQFQAQHTLNSKSNKLSLRENGSCSHSDSSSFMENQDQLKINKPLVPLAALDLLRSRLGNAYDVTPITYLASDLIAEGHLISYIKQLLLSPQKDFTEHSLPNVILDLQSYLSTIGSPLTKRRKLSEHSSLESHVQQPLSIQPNSQAVPKPEPLTTSTDCEFSDSNQAPHLTQEAACLGHYMRRTAQQHWNYAYPALIRQQSCSSAPSPNLIVFPYALVGSHLLRSPLKQNSLVSSESAASNTSSKPISHVPAEYETLDVSRTHDNFMTACCRCGHIVPRTFPIDPHSSISAVVCERLTLSDGQYTQSKSTENISYPNSFGVQYSSSTALPGPSRVVPSPKRKSESSTSQKDSNNSRNMFYLIDQTSGNSMLSIVNRSITEVIAGLFVDMGEYGSANNLQDITYRICRWELSLCRPVKNIDPAVNPLNCNPNPKEGSFLPMPANIAVSYHTNSLVIPHARVFNDSSICLSPDGRMLAAFVVPHRAKNIYVDGDSSGAAKNELRCHTSETILAVYRLQPKQRRGQCLFARRFVDSNPVCIDFSPLGDFLVVGLATTRLPSESYSSGDQNTNRRDIISYHNSMGTTDAPMLSATTSLCSNHTSIACILHLERMVKTQNCQDIRRNLRNIVDIKHPSLLNPVSSRYADNPQASGNRLDRWHRLLLSTSDGLSLNTIVWNPNGSILYGTTKGLLVIMQACAQVPLSIPSFDCSAQSSVRAADECDKISKEQRTNSSIFPGFHVSESNDC